MKTASIRQIRHDLGTVLSWIEDGEQVEVTNRGKIVALLSPPRPPVPARSRKKRPDFMARLQRIYGNKVLQGDVIVEERNSRPY